MYSQTRIEQRRCVLGGILRAGLWPDKVSWITLAATSLLQRKIQISGMISIAFDRNIRLNGVAVEGLHIHHSPDSQVEITCHLKLRKS